MFYSKQAIYKGVKFALELEIQTDELKHYENLPPIYSFAAESSSESELVDCQAVRYIADNLYALIFVRRIECIH